jgi:hypothetical protein
VLVGQQSPLLGLRADLLEEGPGNVASEQPVPVLGKHRGVPDPVVHGQAHEPPEQQVVVELLHEQALAADAVEYLQQQRAQQVLRRDRGPADLGVELVELRRQFPEHDVHHRPQGAQGMVGRNALLQRHVAPHV